MASRATGRAGSNQIGAEEAEARNTFMASIKMISEQDAEGRVKDIYDEIKSTLEIDFVPNSI